MKHFSTKEKKNCRTTHYCLSYKEDLFVYKHHENIYNTIKGKEGRQSLEAKGPNKPFRQKKHVMQT